MNDDERTDELLAQADRLREEIAAELRADETTRPAREAALAANRVELERLTWELRDLGIDA